MKNSISDSNNTRRTSSICTFDRHRGTSWVVIAVLLMFCLMVGGFIYNYGYLPWLGEPSVIPLSGSQSESDWKEFKDVEMGFSIKIPNHWEVVRIDKNLAIEIYDADSKAVVFGYTQSSLKEFLDDKEYSRRGIIADRSVLYIDEVKSQRVTLKKDKDSTYYEEEVKIPMPSWQETLFWIDNIDNKVNFDKILDSFRFVDKGEME